jgi:hypothetical protein
VRVIDGERPAERRRRDAAEVLATLVEVVGEVADLGVLRLAVEVLQQQAHARALGQLGGALQALDARRQARREVAREVVAAVHDDPRRPELPGDVDVRRQVLLGRLGQHGRRLGDVDGGGGVQSHVNPVPLAGRAHRGHALGGPLGRRIEMPGRAFQAGVDIAHAMLGRPRQALLEPPLAAEIDADALAQRHRAGGRLRLTASGLVESAPM